MRLSHDGRSGSSSGSNVENARRCTGWGASRGGTPTCLSCGSSACDRRLECRSRMRREFHVRFCEGGGVRAPSATRLIVHRPDVPEPIVGVEKFKDALRKNVTDRYETIVTTFSKEVVTDDVVVVALTH